MAGIEARTDTNVKVVLHWIKHDPDDGLDAWDWRAASVYHMALVDMAPASAAYGLLVDFRAWLAKRYASLEQDVGRWRLGFRVDPPVSMGAETMEEFHRYAEKLLELTERQEPSPPAC